MHLPWLMSTCSFFARLASSKLHSYIARKCKHALQVTAILYANPDWQSEHGGQLRIWVPPTASSMSASSIANDDHVDQLDHFVLRPSNQSATSATSSAESPCSLTGAHVTSAAATEQQSPAHVRNAGASAQASQDNHGAAQQLNGSDLEQQDSRPPQAHNDSVGEQLNSLHIEDNGSAEQDHCQATQSTNGQHSRYGVTLLTMPCTVSVQLEHIFLRLVSTKASQCPPHSCSTAANVHCAQHHRPKAFDSTDGQRTFK